MRGAQIWVKIGDPAPADPSELTFLATDTRTPYLAKFDGADAKKVAAGGTDGVPLLLSSATSKGPRRALLESSATNQILNPEP